MPRAGTKNNVYVRAVKCGHWTTQDYCEKQGLKIHSKEKIKDTSRLKKDGTPVKIKYREWRANILCAKCSPKTKAQKEYEKEKHKIYRNRAKKRNALMQKCFLCGKNLRPRKDSTAFESVYGGILNEIEAKRKILIAHLRHEHTNYDMIRLAVYEREREDGAMWEEAHAIAKKEARKQTATELKLLITKCSGKSD